jgi:two-component system, cell cycle response regulator
MRAPLGRRAAWQLRRLTRATAGLAIALLAALLVASGALAEVRLAQPRPIDVILVVIILGVVIASVAARLRFTPPTARAQRGSLLVRLAAPLLDVQVGVALVIGAYALVELSGGQASPALPLVYFLLAFAVTFLVLPGAIAAGVAVLGFEVLLAVRGGRLVPALEHGAYLALAASAHSLFLRGLVFRLRRAHEERLAAEVQRLHEEARDFRLIACALGADSRPARPREEEERKLAEGAVETIHASMYHTLEMLKAALDLTTCVLLWLDDSGARLAIKELVTDSDAVVETALPADAGALGAIVRDRLLLNLPAPKRGHVPYYGSPEEVGAFLGVPVLEDGHLRGVLCADRRAAGAFAPRDEQLLLGAVAQILRAIQSERVFAAVERSKYEHERFYHASALLGRALTLEQVMDTAIDAAREICAFEMSSISLYDKERKRHRVSRVSIAPGAEDIVDGKSLDGHEFGESVAGLASMVVKNKHYLPAGGELRDRSIPVYSKRIKLKNVESLLVLPLICADEAIGTFTLASRRPHAFGKDAREMLGVIANQVAVSLANAKMYKQMETMATTDGLTGLLNHRTFQVRLTDLLGRSERHGLPLALLLTDIDHFKKVNDTYGHPVGDEVLRRVARVVAESVRKIDIAARYGGEEFAIVLEGAGAQGAVQLAERIRADVAKQVIQSDKGSFSVTLSLGVATVPGDATGKEALIERADQALYHAKHNGRNRTVTYVEFREARASKRSLSVG